MLNGFLTKMQEQFNRKKLQYFHQTVSVEMTIHMQKKTTYICLYSDILKLDHRSKYKTGSCTVIRASHFAMPVSVQIDPFPIQLPAKMCLGRQQKDLAIGYLPATWETQIQFKAPALVWPSPIWRINYYMGVLFLHLSPLNTVVLLK